MKSIDYVDVDWKNTSYCQGCNLFVDDKTNTHFDVPYHSMPAEMALQIMTLRHGLLKRHPPTDTDHQRKRKRPKKGF